MKKAPPGSFQEVFEKRFEDIKGRAAKAGITVTDLCNAAKVSRATPERWKTQTPLTIKIIDRMEKAVVEAEKRAALDAEPSAS